MTHTIAIAGIHTGIGKTIASAVIAEALGADYWKPVQAGIEERDAVLVKELLTTGADRVHEEAVLLSQPMSPHAAARIDGIEIDYTTFKWPVTNKGLIIETAGGLLSPMSASKTMADFISHYKLPTILIAMNYLGSINHTLMTLEVMKSRGILLLGIVMSGDANDASESYIEQYSNARIIARIPRFEEIDNKTVAHYALELRDEMQKSLAHIRA